LQTNTPFLPRAFPVLVFATTAVIIIAANYVDRQYAVLASNFLNLAITGPLVAVSILVLIRERTKGDLGKAFACFASFAVAWFVAERIWTIYELVYKADPWPSEADFFWLAGYPLYIAFTIFYLRPFRNTISLKLVASAIAIAAAMSILLTYHIALQESSLSEFETVLGLAYPLADTVSLVPVMVGLALFFRGQVSFLWSCMLFGMLCFVVADYGYLIFSLENSYYTGRLIDIPYLWAYVFFLFGSYNHAKVFKKRSEENRFNDQEKFR
jgi:hypothetical protein